MRLERDEGQLHELARSISAVQDALRAYDSAIRDALEGFGQATRHIQSQLAAWDALWRDTGGLYESLVHATDVQTVTLSSRLAEAGWWFFPLLHFLPYGELSSLDEVAQTGDLDDLNRRILLLFRGLMGEEPLVGGVSLTRAVEDALSSVDPTGGHLRGRYFRQARRAFKLGGMHSLIPPAMFGQVESLVAVASHRGVLRSDPKAYRQIFNGVKKAKRLTKSLKHAYTPAVVKSLNTDLLLPTAFVHQFDVLDILFRRLTRDVGVDDYASVEEISTRASEFPSRHYVVHGGLGVDTEVHAARAMSLFIGTTFMLRDVQRLGALVDGQPGQNQ